MLLIGERINGMFTDIKQAIAAQDPGPVQDWAKKQEAAGASFLDINVGTASADPIAAMKWLVETAQAASGVTLCIDSQKFDVLQAGVEAAKKPVLINSVQGEEEALDKYFTLAKAKDSSVICLTMNNQGVPQNVDMRVEIAATILGKAAEHEIEPERLFIDPIILPVNVAQNQPGIIMEAIRQILELSDPKPHITCGLSNLSQRTKERSLINRIFLAMAVAAGLDSAIVDVCDTPLVDAAITAEMLMNKQIYSDSFLKAARVS